MPKRKLAPKPDDLVDRRIPLAELINFGPVTLEEFHAMGLTTLKQLDELGWEGVCRMWVQFFPERLNVNAFIGVIATLEGVAWTQITAVQKSAARELVNELRGAVGRPRVRVAKKRKR